MIDHALESDGYSPEQQRKPMHGISAGPGRGRATQAL
jgi:hypothetical protein